MTSLSSLLLLAVAQELLCQASLAYRMPKVEDAKSKGLYLSTLNAEDANPEKSEQILGLLCQTSSAYQMLEVKDAKSEDLALSAVNEKEHKGARDDEEDETPEEFEQVLALQSVLTVEAV
ncbi:unnamed protein product [Dibothriocephalus latus]|uniref:Uncharacterized protein n=1 Tax=Dibothriocephalus latus TaxID=60516 RepID=A0A3P7NZE7_DIBLA|nr:unnamed protein product [Dibothriocephalus latus]